MKIYTGTSWSISNQEKCARLNIGMMSSPVDLVHPDKIIREVSVAGDNSAFRCFRDRTKFDELRFYNWLDSLTRHIDFVPYPDIVCGKMASYEYSKKHLGRIPDIPAYFVVQDGMTFDLVYPALSECDGCFIGGSTNVGECSGWKWQVAPREFIKPCHDIGLPVHMGRCPGNLKGLDAAAHIGIDSIDVSTLIRHQLLDRVPQMRQHRKEQIRFGVTDA
jgi:hypothetical protein